MSNFTDCPFCNLTEEDRIISENETFIAKYDRYPVNEGHTLLIPKRHVGTFLELTDEERMDFFTLLSITREHLQDEFGADGYNIGINEGTAAGQSIPHLHIHIIPRYFGDIEKPHGGVRNLIPREKHQRPYLPSTVI